MGIQEYTDRPEEVEDMPYYDLSNLGGISMSVLTGSADTRCLSSFNNSYFEGKPNCQVAEVLGTRHLDFCRDNSVTMVDLIASYLPEVGEPVTELGICPEAQSPKTKKPKATKAGSPEKSPRAPREGSPGKAMREGSPEKTLKVKGVKAGSPEKARKVKAFKEDSPEKSLRAPKEGSPAKALKEKSPKSLKFKGDSDLED